MDFGVILLGSGTVLAEQTGVWYISWAGSATVSPTAVSATIINQTYDSATNVGSAFVNMPASEPNLMLSFKASKGVQNLVVSFFIFHYC